MNTQAYALRENTGTTGLERTLRDAVYLLAHHQMAHLVAGGLAVQEHGYFRVTLDVDIIVGDVLEAVDVLTGDPGGPFANVPQVPDRLQDKRNGVFIDFLPGGSICNPRAKVPFPMPKEVIDIPRFVTLEQLVALKLDSWSSSPTRRLKDKTDVIELIKSQTLPRDLNINEPVRHLYVETWDALEADK